MDYYLNFRNLLLWLCMIGGISAFAQQKVTGTVTSEKGLPLPGVSVIQKGVLNGTVTDFDGVYELTLSAGEDLLVISYLGFQTEEVKVATQS